MKNTHKLTTLLVALLVAACGEAPPAETDEAAMPAPAPEAPIGTVSIVAPTEGGQVMGTTVTVRLEVAGFPIVPAGDTTSGTGHHHLYFDADLTAPDSPVPTVPGSIIHMGDGSSEFTFEDITPGEHRIIAVVADGIHNPLQPWVVDTVTFTVN